MNRYFITFSGWKKSSILFFICFWMASPFTKAMGDQPVKSKDDIGTNKFLSPGQSIHEKTLLDSDTLPHRSKKENPAGWEILFNGENTKKWKGARNDDFPSDGWIIKDGALFLNKKGSGDIITRETFGNFELVLDFKLTHGANSGVKYFVGKLRNKKTGEEVSNGPEYQIIDDFNHPEVKDHKHDIAATASCYLLYTPENKRLHPAGQWNHVKIVANGKHVEHWLNGVKVLSYERGSEDFLRRKASTKFKDYEGYGELVDGHILLTDHGDKVYFKNIKIKRL